MLQWLSNFHDHSLALQRDGVAKRAPALKLRSSSSSVDHPGAKPNIHRPMAVFEATAAAHDCTCCMWHVHAEKKVSLCRWRTISYIYIYILVIITFHLYLYYNIYSFITWIPIVSRRCPLKLNTHTQIESPVSSWIKSSFPGPFQPEHFTFGGRDDIQNLIPYFPD